MLYFDHSATTQPSSQALETFNQVAANFYANPSSLHPMGRSCTFINSQPAANRRHLSL